LIPSKVTVDNVGVPFLRHSVCHCSCLWIGKDSSSLALNTGEVNNCQLFGIKGKCTTKPTLNACSNRLWKNELLQWHSEHTILSCLLTSRSHPIQTTEEH